MDCCNLVGAVSPILGSSTNGKSGKNVFRHPSRWKKKNISKSKITKPRRYKNLIHPNSIHFGCTEVLLVDPNIIKRTSNGHWPEPQSTFWQRNDSYPREAVKNYLADFVH